MNFIILFSSELYSLSFWHIPCPLSKILDAESYKSRKFLEIQIIKCAMHGILGDYVTIGLYGVID